MEIPNKYYRISTKALILDEIRSKFLLALRDDGAWDLLGGGLDFGENSIDGLKREIKEETGIEVVWIAERPSFFFTAPRDTDGRWCANVVYEVQLKNLEFIPSGECLELKFVTREEALELPLYFNVKKFLEAYQLTIRD